MTPTGLACSKKEWMKFTASASARSVSAPTVPAGTTRPSYSSAETSENIFSTVKVSPGFTSLFMVWASPVSMPTTSTVAPSASTAFLGSVNSACSEPTGARRIAIFLPCNSLATNGFLSICLHHRNTRRERTLNCEVRGLRVLGARKLCAHGGEEFVEGRGLEFGLGERLFAGLYCFVRLGFGDQGDGASAESSTGKAGSHGAVLFRRFHEGV